MKKSLEETLKEVELSKEIYRLYALEHCLFVNMVDSLKCK